MVRSVVTVHRSLRNHSPAVDEEGSCSFLLFFSCGMPEPGEFGAPTLRHQQVDFRRPSHPAACFCASAAVSRGLGARWGHLVVTAVRAFPTDPRSFASTRSSCTSPPGKESCRRCCSCWVSSRTSAGARYLSLGPGAGSSLLPFLRSWVSFFSLSVSHFSDLGLVVFILCMMFIFCYS